MWDVWCVTCEDPDLVFWLILSLWVNGRQLFLFVEFYGVLVAYALFFPNHKLGLIFIPVPIAAKFFVPALLLIDLFSGVTGFSLFGGGVAHFAHIGGAIVGFLLLLIWRKEFTRNARIH